MTPRAILFDWDNTLIDSWGCIREATNATLVHMGHRPWTMEETIGNVALSMRDSFPRMFGERWTEARDFFYKTFAEIHLDHLRPLPGAADAVETLAAKGIYLGVVSNKNGRFLRKEAQHLGWDRWFRRLVGATDAARDKPWRDPVDMALEGSGIAAGADVWFVGDAAIDMECAVNSGCIPVLVREREETPGEFNRHPPARRFRDFAELLSCLDEFAVSLRQN